MSPAEIAAGLTSRLLWHVEQVCGPLSTQPSVVAGDDDRSILEHNFRAILSEQTTVLCELHAALEFTLPGLNVLQNMCRTKDFIIGTKKAADMVEAASSALLAVREILKGTTDEPR